MGASENRLRELAEGDFTAVGKVPPVTATDLAAVLMIMLDFADREDQEHGHVGVDSRVYQDVCSPGADVSAMWFRAVMLCLALKQAEFPEFEQNPPFRKALMQLWAEFTFTAISGEKDGGFHLDLAEFKQELRKTISQS